jgi:AP-4 complex subunit epsilon-1
MKNEVLYLKQRLSDPKVEKSKMREYLVRLLYVELLGHDASFGHIHAVKLCSDADLVNKKVAYLTTCLFLSENSELLILLMNTMKSDLHSDNYLVVCAALETLCHLGTEDGVPLILPSIKQLLTHNKELVRKKAVMALHRFYLKAPHLITDYGAMCRKVLCDHDPSVMGAALCALYEGIKRDPTPYKNLVKSLLHVLAQIVDRRLPKSYDNHRAPAPFLQIKVLKMLALLGQGDKAASSQMHPVILTCLKSANSGTGIGNALVYECVRTAIAIHPDANLLTASAAMVAHFLNSSHAGTAATAANNLKYVALDALGGIVQVCI